MLDYAGYEAALRAKQQAKLLEEAMKRRRLRMRSWPRSSASGIASAYHPLQGPAELRASDGWFVDGLLDLVCCGGARRLMLRDEPADVATAVGFYDRANVPGQARGWRLTLRAAAVAWATPPGS
jgi:hypothetical protein